MQIETLTDVNFNTVLESGSSPAVVVFKTDWYGTTYIMAPIIADVAETYAGKMAFYKFDYDKDSPVTQRYEIRNIITFLFFNGLQVVGQITGPVSAAVLKDKINDLFFPNAMTGQPSRKNT